VTESDRDELARDVYAHFGLALYEAQVLEHGLANAMSVAAIAAGRLPTREDYDAFLLEKFERTLGGLIKDLGGHVEIDPSLQGLLQVALLQRNWLAHRYFRERSEVFVTRHGCESMIAELQAAQELFEQADAALTSAVSEFAAKIGITQESVDAYVAEVMRRGEDAG
jgi:hypothetical protein